MASSILDSKLDDQSFDCVLVVGGLHHLHPHIDDAICEINRILRPEGYFCFCEAHRESLPDVLRYWWYKHDPLFADNEAAINLQAMKRTHGSLFRFKVEAFSGNIGYLLVLQSLIFRIPLWLKSAYSPLLLGLESIIMHFQGRSSCFVVGQWQKR